MKKIIKVAVAFLLAATVFSPLGNVQAAPNDVVNIPDKNLLEGLKKITSKVFADELTEADLATIGFAEISYMPGIVGYPVTGLVRDLTGLEKATNMTKIHFSGQKELKNLAAIKEHPKLQKVIGVNTGLTDISALDGMPALEEVELGGDYITDFSSLTKVKNLRYFSYDSRVWLDPGYHQINDEEFHVFVTIDTLEELHLNMNRISDLSPLNGNTYIVNLDISRNLVKDLTSLTTMKKLRVLYTNENNLTSLDGLKTLRGLRIAYADNNHITDLSNLKAFYESMEPFGDYKGFQVNNQTITLPTINIKEGETAVSKHPTLDINGQKMPISAISDGGSASADNQTVDFEGLPVGDKTVTYKATFTATSPTGVPLSYSIKVSQPIHVAALAESNVIVKYQDETGKELAATETISGKAGDAYQTVEKAIIGYKLKEIQGEASGNLTDADKTVVYVYEKVAGAPVTVKYEDEQGNELANADTLTGKLDTPYETTAKNIVGWTVKTTPSNAQGTFTDKEQTVTYVYEKADGAAVTVKYEDEKDNKLTPSEKLSGKLDAPYETTAKNIAGWTVKTTPNNAQGTFTDKEQIVTYVYEKADGAAVTVKYEDEKGNELAPSEKRSGKLDAPYETTAKNIAGWKLVAAPSNAEGKFTAKEQTVVYVYKKASDKNKPSVPKKPNKQGDKKAKPTKKTPKKNYKNTPKDQKNDPEKIHLPSTGDVWMDSAIYILAGLSALIAGAILIRRRKHV